MKVSRCREPLVGQLSHPFPCETSPLTAAPQRAKPELGHIVPEGTHLPLVRWNGMIGEVALDDLAQPFPLLGDRLVHAPSQLLLDLPEPRPHAVATRVALYLEREDLAEIAKKKWDVTYAVTSIGRILRETGLPRQKMRPSHPKKDPEVVEAFLKNARFA